jgi:hypothetical protein
MIILFDVKFHPIQSLVKYVLRIKGFPMKVLLRDNSMGYPEGSFSLFIELHRPIKMVTNEPPLIIGRLFNKGHKKASNH